jgi:hypothetical protein
MPCVARTHVKEVCGAAASNTMHSSCDHIAEQGIHARISMWVAQRHHPTTPFHLSVAHFELSLQTRHHIDFSETRFRLTRVVDIYLWNLCLFTPLCHPQATVAHKSV